MRRGLKAGATLDRAADEPGSARASSPGRSSSVSRPGSTATGFVRGLARDDLALHVQPLLDRRSQRNLSVAAWLRWLRWLRPIHGLRRPDAFSPILAQSGLIRAAGLPDHGMGIPSLHRLRRPPLHALTINRFGVTSLLTVHADAASVRSTIALCHALGISVVAEGMQDPATLVRLPSDSWQLAQGFGIGRPVSEAESFSIMPTHHAKRRPLVVANARHSWAMAVLCA